jgi:hypothetical protein
MQVFLTPYTSGAAHLEGSCSHIRRTAIAWQGEPDLSNDPQWVMVGRRRLRLCYFCLRRLRRKRPDPNEIRDHRGNLIGYQTGIAE